MCLRNFSPTYYGLFLRVVGGWGVIVGPAGCVCSGMLEGGWKRGWCIWNIYKSQNTSLFARGKVEKDKTEKITMNNDNKCYMN